MKLLIILVAIAIAGSMQAVSFAGRIVTIGDFILFAVIPLSGYLASRQSSRGSRIFGATEISMACLLLLLPITANLAGMLSNGTFLNGYRSLGFALFLYVAGRLISSERQVVLVVILIFSLVGYVLYQSGKSISDFRHGQEVTHLVGYEQEGLGNTINNLNLYGILWCSLACLSVPFANAAADRKNVIYVIIPSLMIGLSAPGVFSSFSRSAYIYYLFVIVGFSFVLFRTGRGATSFLVPLMTAAVIVSQVLISLSSLSYETSLRIFYKISDLVTESEYRLQELLISPIAGFFQGAPAHEIFIGSYNQPQHSSLSHYFIMFGFFGLVLYMVFQINLILDGFRLARVFGKKNPGASAIAAFSSFFCFYLLANDLATNLLYYSPTYCYIAYFITGLCRPYPNRYAQQ